MRLYYYGREAWVASANRGQVHPGKLSAEPVRSDCRGADGGGLHQAGPRKPWPMTARRVLELNYPKHPYLTGDWPQKKGLWRQLNPFAGELN